jgi:hypothetical protein
MYPAIEITLRLHHVCAAQPWSPTALESASRACTWGTNLLPHDAAHQDHEPSADLQTVTIGALLILAQQPEVRPAGGKHSSGDAGRSTGRLSRLCIDLPMIVLTKKLPNSEREEMGQ